MGGLLESPLAFQPLSCAEIVAGSRGLTLQNTSHIPQYASMG
jgi:hypothetical protein